MTRRVASGRRPGATLIEIVVVFAISVVLVAVAYQGFQLLGRQEAGVNRRAVEAMKQAQMMETLLRDLRSAQTVIPDGAGGYRIRRFRAGAAGLAPVEVVWTRLGPARIRRAETGGATTEFDFRDLLAPGTPAIDFRITRVEDVVFQP